MLTRLFERKNSAEALFAHRRNLKYSLALEGVVVGIAAGLVVVLYRWAMMVSATNLKFVLSYADDHWWLAAAWFGALILMALAVGGLMKWEPFIAGGGISEVEGELKGYFHQPWLRVIVGKLLGGVLCILGGLSVGREGPSVQLGAMSGKGYSTLMKRSNLEQRFLITCGASAGLAAAFNVPLAGVLFAMEEVHKDYSVTVLFSAMTASLVADVVSKNIFGMAPVFRIPVDVQLPMGSYWLLLLLGVILGLAGAIYTWSMDYSQRLYAKIKGLKPQWRPVIPFIMAGIFGFTLPEVLGDGHIMLEDLAAGGMALKTIVILLVAKFIFSMASSASGAPGGSLAPMLAIGAFIGGAFGNLAVMCKVVDATFINNFIILAMAGYFTAVIRAPLTAIVLICELTGSLSGMLSISIVVIVAEMVSSMVGSEPVYEMLLNKLLKRQKQKNPSAQAQAQEAVQMEKTLISVTVQNGSELDGQTIAAVKWPESTLIVDVMRDGGEMIPQGDTVLHPGDTLTVLANNSELGVVGAALRDLCEEDITHLELD